MIETVNIFKILKINNKNIWIIWKNENSIFIGYKCILFSNGATNVVYKTIEYHEFLDDSLISIIEKIKNKRIIKSTYKIVDNLVFRFNKLKEDYDDVVHDNLLLLKLYNITYYVLKPLYYFDSYQNFENGILSEKKISLYEVLNKMNYNIVKNIKIAEKEIINFKNDALNNNIKLKKIDNKLQIYKMKLEFAILHIINKVIIMIESLIKNNFRHGDLKINNILCENHTTIKNIEKLKIYMTDFGHSGIIIKNETLDILSQTTIFQDYILRNKDYDDITFFILHLYATSRCFFKNYKIYDDAIKNIIIKLYDNKFILDKYKLKTKDPWALYYNNIKVLQKDKENYIENIRIYDFKYAIKENYKEIIENRINEIKFNLNIK